MLNVDTPFIQEVIRENEQIHQRISDELRKANAQVLVTTPWFTDRDLFQVLSDLADRGIDVRVIISDIEDNKKLDFNKLRQKGATVYKVKASGYGGMREKFCVIDKQVAIHGSYSWTVNARLNTRESVIVTNHIDTVESLIKQFHELEAEVQPLNKEHSWFIKTLSGLWKGTIRVTNKEASTTMSDHQPVPEVPEQTVAVAEKTAPIQDDHINFREEYASVLDKMIAAEVCNFDRDLLRSQGYERAKNNNGDAQVLNSALDTVYSVFINDINVVEDKKKRLIGKIHEQKVIHAGTLENSYQIQLRSIEAQTEGTKQELTVRAANLRAKADTYEMDISTIKEQKLVAAEKEEKEIEAHIRDIEQDRIKPKFKWYEFIPVSILSIGLFFYLLIFYSSAVYILLFSETEARAAQLHGDMYDPPQVFEPRAFDQIFEKGWYAIAFLSAFIFIPLTISVIKKLVKDGPLSKGWVSIIAALAFEGGIAYKVASSSYEAAYLVGDVSEEWYPTKVFFESNFYLVFLLGSLGLFIFNALFGKFISLFEERNPGVRARQLKLQSKQEGETLLKHRQYIAALNETKGTFQKELVQARTNIHILEIELAGLPHKKALSLEKAAQEFENNKRILSDVTAVYISHIENDILPISIDSMKDRINVFLEGWTGFLNDEYAIVKAAEKSRQAIDAAGLWQQEKLIGNRIDNRIKQPYEN